MSEPTLNRILYVEDDADIRGIVKMSLEKIGKFQVAACDSCSDALCLVDDFNPDLLLLDVMMPDVDGPATLQLLRERVSDDSAPAIFITAKVEPGDMARYKNMGVLDVVVKPFDPMTLSEQIEQIWQRHRSGLREFNNEEITRQLAQKSADFVAQLPHQVQTLTDDLAAWLSAPQEALLFERLKQSVHRLKGAGGTFGCNSISDASRALEQSLTTLRTGNATGGKTLALDEVEVTMEALREEASRIYGESTPGSQPGTRS